MRLLLDTNGIIKCLIIKNIYLLKQSKTIIIWGKNLLLKKYDSKMSNSYNFFTNNDFLQIDLKYLLYKRGLSFYSDNYINKVDYLKRFQYLDLNTFLPEACLTRADRSSMANGLEVRVPYLDHHIFDFLYSLDTNVYFNSNKKKILIRNNISKQVAKEVFNAPKTGFSFKSYNTSIDEVFKKLMKDSVLKVLIYFQILKITLKEHLII